MGSLIQKAASVSGLTLASRLLGVVRDALIAWCFGASPASDAFFIAFRPFDLLRKMFSDGILSISFVPEFSRYLSRGERREAFAMFRSALFLVSAAGAALTIIGMIAAPFLVRCFVPGYAGTESLGLTAMLFRVMVPYLCCVLAIALCMGVLNALGNFHAPAATPIWLNAAIIGTTLAGAAWLDIGIVAAAVGVTLGGGIQLAFQIPFLVRAGLFRSLGGGRPGLRQWVRIHPGVSRAAKVMVPCMVGAAAFQINLVVTGLLAAMLAPGCVTFLYYADRLVQFPLALFGISVSTVLLPRIAACADPDPGQMARVFENGARMVLFLTIPAMAGIMALDRPIVSVLFGRGAFGPAAQASTAQCLFYLATGLGAAAASRVFVTLYYALSQVRVPFWAGLSSLGTNLVLSLVLMPAMGVAGLALAPALAAVAGLGVLVAGMPGVVDLARLMVCACRSLFLSGIMYVLVRQTSDILIPEGAGFLVQGAGLGGCILLGAAVFAGLALVVARSDLVMLRGSG